jgi:hypothetical protein
MYHWNWSNKYWGEHFILWEIFIRDTFLSRTSYSQMNHWMRMTPMEKKNIVQVNTNNFERYSRYPQLGVHHPPRIGRVTSYQHECVLKNILAEEPEDVAEGETEYMSRYGVREKADKKRTNPEVSRKWTSCVVSRGLHEAPGSKQGQCSVRLFLQCLTNVSGVYCREVFAACRNPINHLDRMCKLIGSRSTGRIPWWWDREPTVM